jgi:hypothetical protein
VREKEGWTETKIAVEAKLTPFVFVDNRFRD